MTGIVPLPPFPLDWRNHDEQRTSPTDIPADTECSFRQRGLQEIYCKEKAEEKKVAQVDSLRCCAACIDSVAAVKKYTDMQKLDAAVLREFIDRI